MPPDGKEKVFPSDGDRPVHDDTTGEVQGLPHSRRLAIMGRLHRASSPSVPAGQRLPVKVHGERTREDGLDPRLRLPYLAAIMGMGEVRPGTT